MVACGIVLVVTVGCNNGSKKGEVRGTVTLDGKPLEDGTIRLTPIKGQAGTAGGTIKNGQFTTTAAAAKYRVEISSTKIDGGDEAAGRHGGSDYTAIQLIPEKYNANSTLTLDVVSGLNEPKFELESK